ncbi:MAG TPA: tRNA (adenosine(37)-N6)-threonylcarbamoyltransferase complex dimerization subunit type 1 TsaB [Candidatus Saccharimonadales bacterium]|jgi:tRNA threonylcarbamoyladenosine biosynthesis protein TsaB|nr:tRNA (adenosine(37)-N6)-threonylcarbamoyltransferase complex dimerization subunit type 1 TsaB [Candidatus Saccharimonadales bacterium]
MRIALRTDSATAELVLLDAQGKKLGGERWEAGRQLSSQLLDHIQALLLQHALDWDALTGVIVFRGPGSFTGLRIGVAVANAIAYAQAIPIVGTDGEQWVATGAKRLQAGETDTQVLPNYGTPPHITRPRK